MRVRSARRGEGWLVRAHSAGQDTVRTSSNFNWDESGSSRKETARQRNEAAGEGEKGRD
jgi:hypothetical protein